ncbi:ClpX, ATPase regulatory subunit [Exidia glandulosa HHB12029]|uniref:ClpX, ATPase regulatory subunit n=1 Tax=Exidia glandulosa HHB12029 TaxID=1314781 RepID=A0A165QUI6_EXIGL|nr:ClpX, ATPase regulatory subunit [Exidia glandulosa HHB12029]
MWPAARRLMSTRPLRTVLKETGIPRDNIDPPPSLKPLATPRQLVQYLDEFVVGQEMAKKVLSVAVFNHMSRIHSQLGDQAWNDYPTHESYEPLPHEIPVTPHPQRQAFSSAGLHRPIPLAPLFEKSNVLLIGPTGSGKTLLVRTLAKVLDLPFSVSDATSFTQVRHVGDDVEQCIHRLLQAANWDPFRASTGIVYIDEADKLAKRGSGGGTDSVRDVGGEGVQQSLLRMLEGSVVTINTKPSGSESSSSDPRARHDTYHVDTSNTLFILSGAFVGLEQIIQRRVAKGSIGFTAPLTSGHDHSHDHTFIPFFSAHQGGSDKPRPTLLDQVEPGDLYKYGLIPEFVGRCPSIATLQPLSQNDLLRILMDVKGSLVSQYTALFGYSGVEIRFTTRSLREVAKRAMARGGGARGLRAIMENVLLESMYEVPGSSIRHVLITEDVVRGRSKALYWSRGDAAAFWNAWAAEEESRTPPAASE